MADSRQIRIAETLADALEPFLDGIEIRDEVVRTAKTVAGIDEIPSNERPLREFVVRYLVPALRAVATPDRVANLDPAIDGIVGAVRALERRPSMVPRPISQIVVVASTRPDRVAQLEVHLGEALSVQIVGDVSSLDSIVMASVASAVVLDCESFPVDAHLVTHLSTSVGARKIVLWGVSPGLEAQLAERRGEVPVGCAPGAPMQHVAMLTKALVAGRHG